MRKPLVLVLASLLVNSANAAVWQYAARAGAFLDVQLPPGAGPFPLVVAIHGGGWESGSRKDAFPFCRVVLTAGFGCASVDYRLAPSAPFPAPVDDIRDAIAFLQSKTAAINVIPGKFILAGESAGGQLAAVAAIRANGQNGIAGVAAFSSPFDLVMLSEAGRPLDIVPEQISQFLGIHGWTADTLARMQAASPSFLVNPESPPFLVIRGAEDRLVPAAQSQAFCEKAMAVRISCTVITIPQAKHGLWGEMEIQRFDTQWIDVFVEWARKLTAVSHH